MTEKGKKVMDAMMKQYGSKKKAKEVFYATMKKKGMKGMEGPKRK